MKKNYLRLSVVISYIYLAVSILGAYFVTPKLLDYIGDSNYGLLSFCNSITTWLATISTALGSSYIFFAKKESEDCSQAKTTNTVYFKIFAILAAIFFSLVIVITGLLFAFNVPFSSYSLEESKIIYILLTISGANVCITILLSIFNVYLIADKEFLFLRAKVLIVAIATHGFNLLFAFLTHSIIAIAIVSLSVTVISSILNVIYSLKARKMQLAKTGLKENKGLINSLIVYSSFVLINTVVSTMNNNMDKTLLGIIVDSKSVTYYSLAFTFTLYLTMMIGSISESFMPRIHELYNEGKNDEADKLFIKISKLQSLIIVFVVVGFIACGYNFCLLWIKQERIQVYYYAVALNLLTVVPLTSTTCLDCERALNKHKFRAIVYLSAALVNLGISVVLLLTIDKQYAIWCCIVGTTISKVISEFVILPIYDKKVINLSIGTYYLNLLKMLLFSAISLVFPLIYHYLLSQYISSIIASFIIEGLSFAVIYGVLVLLFERKFIVDLFPKLNLLGKKKNA